MDPTITLLVGLFGGGTLATLVGLVLKYRADNARTFAEARKTTSEGEVVVADAVMRRYDSLFDDLEADLARRDADRDRLTVERDRAIADANRLRLEMIDATGQVKLARAEVIRLQQLVDDLEAHP